MRLALFVSNRLAGTLWAGDYEAMAADAGHRLIRRLGSESSRRPHWLFLVNTYKPRQSGGSGNENHREKCRQRFE